jgi:O-antigen/teichoic acid export membrane protein
MSIAKHTSFNLVAALAPILFALGATPYYLQVIGAERFGLLAICWTITGALGFASLGMGPALSYRLARMDEDAPVARSNHVWMALFLSFAASLVGAALVLAVGYIYFSRFASVPHGLQAEILDAIGFLPFLLPIATLTGVLNGALQGRKRFGALSALGILTAGAASLVPLLAALFVDVDLRTLVLAMLCASGFVLLVQIAICARTLPLSFPSGLGKGEIRNLLGYGAWMSVTAFIAPILLLFDRFVLGGLSGPAAVAVYVLAFNLLQGLLLIPASLSSAMMPEIAGLRRDEDVAPLLSRSLEWLNGLLTPIIILAIAFSAPFFRLWVGPELGAAAAPVAVILLVGCWLHGIGHMASAVVIGRSRPDLLTKLLLALLLPYVTLLYFATERFGAMGAAAAWTIRAAFDFALFAVAGATWSDMKPVAVSAILVGCTMALTLTLSGGTVEYWGLMSLMLALAVYHGCSSLGSLFGGVLAACANVGATLRPN